MTFRMICDAVRDVRFETADFQVSVGLVACGGWRQPGSSSLKLVQSSCRSGVDRKSLPNQAENWFNIDLFTGEFGAVVVLRGGAGEKGTG
ncbi:MAG: hypothetical protein ACOYLN_08480 [Blastocatellia bacterium]